MLEQHLKKLGELTRGAEDLLETRCRFAQIVQACFAENKDTQQAIANLTQRLL